MLKIHFDKIIKRFGLWRIVHVMLTAVLLILLCSAAVQMLTPVLTGNYESQVSVNSDLSNVNTLSQALNSEGNERPGDLAGIFRVGLFKAATGLRDKPIADKTIERIKSQLKLQCIMEINGRPAAYINIKGSGLRKCCIGDSVNDLFTVLDINKQNKSVEISILEHKLTLKL
ncbi:hypothetical protein ACFL3G_08630 [Planctomycetota bacterium]